MNPTTLLDFALGQLETGPARDAAARAVDADPDLAARLDRLRAGLARLTDDGDDDFEPPRRLAAMTSRFVASHVEAPRATLPFAPPARLRFRAGDFAVAATIFLASLLALTPAILRGRERWGRAECNHNLQKVGMRLHQFAAVHQSYPFVSADSEVPHAGAIVCRLNDAGFPIDPSDLKCPCSGSDCGKIDRVPRLDDVARTLKTSPDAARRMIDNDYAFHIGNYPSPSAPAGPLPTVPLHATPLLGDRPSFDEAGTILPGNSPNHGGRGQNVLFADGHASWQPTRRVSPYDSDLYLNNDNRPSYGLGPDDAVLMPTVLRVNKH